MNSYSDNEIIEGIVNQSSQVLSYIYKVNFRPIRHLVIANNGNESDAKDVFQEALIVIFDKVRNDNLELNCSFGTYIYSVSRNIWLKELSKKKRTHELNLTPEYEYIDIDADIDELYEKNERLKLFRYYFNQLTEDCRKVLTMFLKKYTVSEITGAMNYSSDQHTKNRRYRCKKTLIANIRKSPQYNELKNEYARDDREIPRW
ncbi:MAG: sigma-70 family RNA polymerase sigma factor [Bacteroidetes bacterium]|jgi:RNA polymerase sigma factor (sigma-70 family)|nr:sigma-70 family RNA polymerase sigma factor [Bacteroidota bacterium]